MSSGVLVPLDQYLGSDDQYIFTLTGAILTQSMAVITLTPRVSCISGDYKDQLIRIYSYPRLEANSIGHPNLLTTRS